jgi:hypothetical protein
MNKVAIVLSISVIVAVLTGCSASPAAGPLMPVVPSSVQEQVTATPLAETGIAYTLADGTVSTIDPEAPLPADVVADIVATVTPMLAPAATTEAQAYGASSYASDIAYADLVMTLTKKKAATGRGLVILMGAFGSDIGSSWVPVASGHSTAIFNGVADRSQAVELAEAWASENNADFIDF